MQNGQWSDQEGVKRLKQQMKMSVCIKSKNEGGLDIEKVKELVTVHGIQVSKATVNSKSGDIYVDFPSEENRSKFIPLLSEEPVSVISLKDKCPTISIRGVSNYTDENDFIEKIKAQNHQIKDKIENGSSITVVHTKEHRSKFDPRNKKPRTNETSATEFQVIARVSEDIRTVIKENRDKIFIGFTAHHVTDRFYVKTCVKCHKFGHYQEDCTSKRICGYCMSEDHDSLQCPVQEAEEYDSYKCVNCNENGKGGDGHSSHWHKCPSYIDAQNKVRNSIPYYSKNRE